MTRLVADPDAHLGDGVVVEADVRARLLGMPVLRVEASVVLVPASVRRPAAPYDAPVVTAGRPPGLAAPTQAITHLARARELLDDSERLTARARSVSR